MEEKSPFPYREARLVIPKDRTQRWYIVYYAFDTVKNKLVRVREYDINNEPDFKKREKYARNECHTINLKLRGGATIKYDAEPDRAIFTFRQLYTWYFSCGLAISKSSLYVYKKNMSQFFRYLESQDRKDIFIKDITNAYMMGYRSWLATQNTSPRTRNNYIAVVRIMLQKALDMEVIPQHYLTKLRKESAERGGNLAYPPHMQTKILAALKKADKRLYLVCLTMYYTLMRPAEIEKTQRSQIGQIYPDKLYLPPKNKVKQYRHITIHPALMDAWKEAGFLDMPPDTYLFKPHPSRQRKGGPEPICHLGAAYKRRMRILGLFQEGYTLYSWKHTGVMAMVNAGIPLEEIMIQGGWTSLQIVSTYMKSIGLSASNKLSVLMPPPGGD